MSMSLTLAALATRISGRKPPSHQRKRRKRMVERSPIRFPSRRPRRRSLGADSRGKQAIQRPTLRGKQSRSESVEGKAEQRGCTGEEAQDHQPAANADKKTDD